MTLPPLPFSSLCISASQNSDGATFFLKYMHDLFLLRFIRKHIPCTNFLSSTDLVEWEHNFPNSIPVLCASLITLV